MISVEEELETIKEKEKEIKLTLVRMSKCQQSLCNTDKNPSSTKKTRKGHKLKA